MSDHSLLKIAKSHMATDFEFAVVAEGSNLPRAERLCMDAHELLDLIEGEITEYRESSPVYRLNHATVAEWISFSPRLRELFSVAKRISEESGNYFSPLAKSGSDVIETDLEIDLEKNRMRRMNSAVHLGFGAIGKGFALDQVSTLLHQNGFPDFRLNAGGSSFVFSGLDENGENWNIAWAWKRDSDGDLAGRSFRLPTREVTAIGVSGVLEQGNHFRWRGRAAPVMVQSSFYAGRSAAEADAYSTAVLVGASVEGDEILTRLSNRIRNPAIAYVDLNEQIVYNLVFQNRFLTPQGTVP
jgi:thiamine biosynthesis lipoprotein ApbE